MCGVGTGLMGNKGIVVVYHGYNKKKKKKKKYQPFPFVFFFSFSVTSIMWSTIFNLLLSLSLELEAVYFVCD